MAKKTDSTSSGRTKEESFKVNGSELVNRVKQLIHEGNVRKLTIIDKNGREMVKFPLTIGLVGIVAAPVLAAVGAIAALVTECTITVEREE